MRCRALAPLAALVLLATACSDQAPLTPREPQPSVAAAGQTCDAAGVRLGLASMLTARTTRTRATTLFNAGWTADGRGDHATARVRYYAVLNLVLGAHSAGATREPRFPSSRQASNGVDGLLRAVYACAGDVPPPSLADVLASRPAVITGDRTVCAGAGDLGTTCVIPDERLAIIVEPGFLAAPALFVLEPVATYVDPAFELAYGRQWSRAWSVRALPITAQSNYPAVASDAAAVVGVCVADRLVDGDVLAHPPRGLLQVATRPESEPAGAPRLLPVQTLLDGQDVAALLHCDQPGGPTASSGVLDAFRAAARRLLAPRPLYAFDGGIGGKTSAFLSHYAAVRPPTALFVFSAAPSSSGATSPSAVAGGQLTVAAGAMAQLFVSTTSDVYTPASGCDWGYRPPDTAGAARLIGDAVLALHTGSVWLRASCEAGTVDLRIVVP